MLSGQNLLAATEPRHPFTARAGVLFAALILAAWAPGCGQSTYAERVTRTEDLFRYQAKLDQALQAEWSQPGWGLAMRPPVRFRVKAAPPPAKPNDEGLVEVVLDTRQPSYLGVELPGLVAAWEVPGEAFLYLCSNHQRFVDAQAAAGDLSAPENLLTDLEATLQQGFEFMLSLDPARGGSELHAKFPERIPNSDKFAQPKSFQTIRIRKETEPEFAASVYEHVADKLQVAVIFVYSPKFTTGVSDLESGVRMALETLRVDPVVPRGVAKPGAPGGGGGPRPAF